MIRAEINETITKRKRKPIKPKTWFFEKNSKLDKALAILAEKKRKDSNY